VNFKKTIQFILLSTIISSLGFFYFKITAKSMLHNHANVSKLSKSYIGFSKNVRSSFSKAIDIVDMVDDIKNKKLKTKANQLANSLINLNKERKVVNNNMNVLLEKDKIGLGVIVTMLFGVFSLVMSFLYFKNKDKVIVRKVKQKYNDLPIETKVEGKSSEVKGLFNHSKYPVLICDVEYSVLWSNEFSENLKITKSVLHNIVKTVSSSKKGTISVEFKNEDYIFCINEMYDEADKQFIIQLLPIEKPAWNDSTIIDKDIVKAARGLVNTENLSVIDTNGFISDMLAKMNFIFQLTGTTIEFIPLEEDIHCRVDQKSLYKNFKNIMIEVNNLIKDNTKVSSLVIRLSSFENRLFFDVIIPNFQFTHESWNVFQGENPLSSENFLKNLNAIEAQMSLFSGRVMIKNTNISNIGEAAEISLSFINENSKERVESISNLQANC
jgi:hypothetical protein